MAAKRRRKLSLQVCALIFEGQQLESSPSGPESDAAKEQEVRGPGTNLQRMSYATLSKSASQRLFLICRKEGGVGTLCGGGGGDSSSMQRLLMGAHECARNCFKHCEYDWEQ